jgi:hypothetical protein
MKLKTLWKLLFFVCLIVLSVIAQEPAAEEKVEQKEEKGATTTTPPAPIVKPLEPSPDAVVAYVFPQSATLEFELGKPILLAIGFTNVGQNTFNVTLIKGSLRYGLDWKMIIQNFTEFSYGTLVDPQEHVSFLYGFFPDPMLDPREFGFHANVYYTDGIENYTTVFFNSTIKLIDSSTSAFDAQSVFTYVGITGITGLIAFFIFSNTGTKKKKSTVSTETKTKSTSSDDDWLVGTTADRRKTGSRSPDAQRKK